MQNLKVIALMGLSTFDRLNASYHKKQKWKFAFSESRKEFTGK